MPLLSAGVAQLVEHLTCNQGVASSNPAAGTNIQKRLEILGVFFRLIPSNTINQAK